MQQELDRFGQLLDLVLWPGIQHEEDRGEGALQLQVSLVLSSQVRSLRVHSGGVHL